MPTPAPRARPQRWGGRESAGRPVRRLRAALIAGLTVLVCSCGVGEDAGGTATSVSSGARTTSSSPSTPVPPEQAAGPGAPTRGPHAVTTVVITDDPAAGSPAGDGWPHELAARAEESGSPLELDVVAVGGSGYRPGTPTGPSFTDLVADHVVHSTQLVVFAENDLGTATAADVGRGADAAFAAVEEAAPDALIVVVAPWAAEPALPPPAPEVRQAVQEAAAGAEVTVTYVDPVAEGWPTGAGPQQIAELLSADVLPVVGALARSGAFD